MQQGGDDSSISDEACEALLRELAPERQVAPAHLFEWPRLHRFILGNDHSITEAAAQYRKMLLWREEVGMERRREHILGKPWHPDSVPGMASLLRTMCVTAGTHLDDRSLLWLQFDGRVQLGEIRTKSEAELFDTAYLMVELRQEHLDKLSMDEGRLIRTVQVRDLRGLSIPNLIRDRALMAKLRKIMSVFPTAFPETISHVVILNVPPGFNLLWSIISSFFKPRMKRKLRVLGGDFLEELAPLLGTRGLEALVNTWRLGSSSGVVEVKAEAKEYACLRLECGEVGEWSFTVGAASGLCFDISFVSEERQVREVQARAACKAGEVRGSYPASAAGLLWLAWSNNSGWTTKAATQTIVDLRLAVRRDALPSTGGRSHSSSRQPRPVECGCFGFLAHLGSSGVRPLTDAQEVSERAYAEPRARSLEPPVVEVPADFGGCREEWHEACKGAKAHSGPLLLLGTAAAFLLLGFGLRFSGGFKDRLIALLPL